MPRTYTYLFGPVPSRRLGQSLGIDLNPVKVCSENCIFCQIGDTTTLTADRREWVPTADVLRELEHWFASGNKADFITLAGSGEPTLHTHFGHVLEHVHTLSRGRVRTALLSNGTLFHQPSVRAAARAADIVKVTVSAWNEDSFQSLHNPAPGLTFARLMEGIHAFRREFTGTLWVETMLVTGYNDHADAIQKIAHHVNTLDADAVHLNTTTRPVGSGRHLPPVPDFLLEKYAHEFSPVAEVPRLTSASAHPLSMGDDELVLFLSRHPMTLDDMARWADVPLQKMHDRLENLLRQERLSSSEVNGHIQIRAQETP